MKIKINAARLRPVSRVYLSEHKEGLKSKNAIANFSITVFYDPIEKVYFCGNTDKCYPYFITNDYDTIVDFAISQIERFVDTNETIGYRLGDEFVNQIEKIAQEKNIAPSQCYLAGATLKSMLSVPSTKEIESLPFRKKNKEYAPNIYYPHVQKFGIVNLK